MIRSACVHRFAPAAGTISCCATRCVRLVPPWHVKNLREVVVAEDQHNLPHSPSIVACTTHCTVGCLAFRCPDSGGALGKEREERTDVHVATAKAAALFTGGQDPGYIQQMRQGEGQTDRPVASGIESFSGPSGSWQSGVILWTSGSSPAGKGERKGRLSVSARRICLLMRSCSSTRSAFAF
eukprot:SAG11_NODE_173_length_13507_cov_10.489931_9_plen_182_part_00